MNQRISRINLVMVMITTFIAFQLVWVTARPASGADEKGIMSGLLGSDGNAAPDFEVPNLQGASVKLSQFKGERPVLLYFWATWCPYCIQIKPEVKKIRESIPEEQLAILAINVGGGDSLERVKKYQEAHPAPWTVLYDGDGKSVKAYNLRGIPYFVLVDKEGNLLYQGSMPPADVKKLLKL